ncbi:hypothetical protein BY458DRAFT_453648 [Sporodiniella umbellata]|nr:hypothetical protein BY458DRAFT_453648 [Sporodiniella umbellata]
MVSATLEQVLRTSSFIYPSQVESSRAPPIKYRKKFLFITLVRKIKQLRTENETLSKTVDILKSDIKDLNESRAQVDVSYRRTCESYFNKNDQLEVDLMDKDDEIKQLKQQICDLKSQLNAKASVNEQESDMYVQPTLTELFEQYYEDCAEFDRKREKNNGNSSNGDDSKLTIKVDPDKNEETKIVIERDNSDAQYETKSDSGFDDDDDEEKEEDLSFTDLGDTCIKQALVSKLSSARTRLEFDDLIVKHDAKDEAVAAVLGRAFAQWVGEFFDFQGFSPAIASEYVGEVESGVAEFWDTFLQHYNDIEENQVSFLQAMESAVLNGEKIHLPQLIINNFEHLLFIMYKYNIICGEAACAWWGVKRNTPDSLQIHNNSRGFIQWLLEEDEDGDEEINEEDEYEDEDDEASTIDTMIEMYDQCLSPTSIHYNSNNPTSPCSGTEKTKKSVKIV